jgi:ribose transport system ATP-binding protein
LEVREGEILGIVGVNGAGKSTLVNILGGVLKPDSGSIEVYGKVTQLSSPRDSEELGIALIQQEIQLFQEMNVYENVFLIDLQKYKRNRFLPILDKAALKERTSEYLEKLGCHVSPSRKVGSLSIGEQQTVQIARALAQGGKILLFDEPTSSLSFREKEKLFAVMRSLRESQHSLVFISHYLDEVQEICDKVAVLCDGKVKGFGLAADMNKEVMTALMIPKKIEFIETKSNVNNDVILKVQGLRGRKLPKALSFELHKGEVLGLWGLLGSGRSETIRAILGFEPILEGKIFLQSLEGLKEVKPRELRKECGYITESRHFDGLFLPLPIWKNITSSNLRNFARRLLAILKEKQERNEGRKYLTRLSIVAGSELESVQKLSGGNQQKVVVAKWLSRAPRILLLDEPTRGVDVGAKIEIQNLIRTFAGEGLACLVISSEIEEIQRLCDSAIVLRNGEKVATLGKGDMTNERLVRECLGTGVKNGQ